MRYFNKYFLALISCLPLSDESRILELTDLSKMSVSSLSVDLKEGQNVYKNFFRSRYKRILNSKYNHQNQEYHLISKIIK